MNDRTDQALLKDYAQSGSETAFTELVCRHTNLVYSTAMRLIGDSHLARDISQRVFVALAQNAHKLTERMTLGGWLHRTTHSFSVMTIRTEERRRAREQKAATMLNTPSDSNEVWDIVAAHLDDALVKLSDDDRDLLILRFFERKSAREIAERLGVREEAAQKRTARALEKLREALRSREIVVPVVLLAGTISAQAVQTAPAGMATTLAAQALLNSNVSLPLAASFTKGLKVMTLLKSHPIATALVILACLSLSTGGFVIGKTAARKHHNAVSWQQAVLTSESGTSAAPDLAPATNEVAVIGETSQRQSVREILAEAAEHFRLEKTDPDAWVRGDMALEKLRAADTLAALQQFELYRNEPAIFRRMGPRLMRLWAEIDPHAAIQYATENFQGSSFGAALLNISRGWARQDPAAVWAWYHEASDSGRLPTTDGLWQWPIFAEWATRDTPAAFDRLAAMSPGDERAAIFGISHAARTTENRPAILAAIGQIPDDAQRNRVAEAVAGEWAELEPEAAVIWVASLEFENPAARRNMLRRALSRWSRNDPHAAFAWAVLHAPSELLAPRN